MRRSPWLLATCRKVETIGKIVKFLERVANRHAINVSVFGPDTVNKRFLDVPPNYKNYLAEAG